MTRPTTVRRLSRRWWLIALTLSMVAFFSAATDHFFSGLTFQALANQIPPLLIVATGLTLVLLIGEIDLSVGSVLALSACVEGSLIHSYGISPWVGLLVAGLVGALCGLINGTLVVGFSAPSFLITLGMLEAARGAAYLVTHSQTLYLGTGVQSLGTALPYIGVNSALLLSLGVVGALAYGLRWTAFGLRAASVGGNEGAARKAGVPTRKVRLTLFVIAGLLAGLGGGFQLSYLGSADPNAGLGLELAAIAAVVLGGTSLFGGRADIINTLLGVLVIAILQAGLAQLGASDPTKRIVTGAVIILAVITDLKQRRESLSEAT